MYRNKLEIDNDITEEEIEIEKKKIEKYKEYIAETEKLNNKEYLDPVDDSINKDIINHYTLCVKEAEEKIKKLEAEIVKNKEEIEKLENEIGCKQDESNQASLNNKKDIENKEEIDYLKLIKEFLRGQDIDYKKVETNINFLLENYTSEEIYREILRINNIKNEKANKNPRKYLITSINNLDKIKNDCKQNESNQASYIASYINTDETEEVKNKELINFFEFEEE